MKDFNILINGVGGQGLITLLKIISEAATIEGYDIRTSELHGLSQRGGSVEVHIRFGKEVYTPLVPQSKADLILSLETQEALNGIYYASPKTVFLANKYQTPTFAKDLKVEEILKNLEKVSKNIFLIPASDICQKELGTDVVSGVYLLGYAVLKKFLPLKPGSILEAMKKVVPEKYLDLNQKTIELVKTNAR
ncbi:MAG: indolepyruvate oxidoreductase [Candidatus Nealsonbacteria bacterium CG_4_10_14_0_2_um_filter_38_17]|uniref:Indolepyruvate oxidoreductase n=2 Tax=Candidatus Nealsoniibacteriota TaxID=1817911 RepID=A0A2M7UZ47_9BACT|nr:MAG: indolepyruvate oxidoreductase [Candidatus Nealsonbacteria bacterium CG23_combo_of_CG06-09_8_20_14_all_38_19]PIZ89232.1 MAG: indolepyruvate oxidoreductase [Candidatus Nealsonbacteria bacterium CG_4_10_14_0_2_um_filter_38_17]